MPAIKTISKSLCKFIVPIDSTVKSFKVKANGSLKLHHCLIDIEVQYGRIIAAKDGQMILDYDLESFLPEVTGTLQNTERLVSSKKDKKISLNATKYNHCKIIINQIVLPEMKIVIGPMILIKIFRGNLQVIINDQLAAECVLYKDTTKIDVVFPEILEKCPEYSPVEDILQGKHEKEYAKYGYQCVLDDKYLVNYLQGSYTKYTIIGTFDRIADSIYITNTSAERYLYISYYDTKEEFNTVTYVYDKGTYKIVDYIYNNMVIGHDTYDLSRYYKVDNNASDDPHVIFNDNLYRKFE